MDFMIYDSHGHVAMSRLSTWLLSLSYLRAIPNPQQLPPSDLGIVLLASGQFFVDDADEGLVGLRAG
jgi:hypothetical protein